jgi:dihydropteroate synthase
VSVSPRSLAISRFAPGPYEDVVADVVAFLEERMQYPLDRGVRVESLILNPCPDFAKTPGTDHRAVAASR